MAKKPVDDKKIPVDPALLSDVDRAELDKAAVAALAEEMKQDARDKYYADAKDQLRRGKTPADKFEMLMINAAPYVPFLMLDGVMFYHGYTYKVTGAQAAVLREQMQRSWLHQDEIDGRSKFNPYRVQRNMVIGPRDQGSATRGFTQGAVVSAGDDKEKALEA